MKYTYSVQGLTCDNCAATVTRLLSADPALTNVVVDRSSMIVRLESEESISPEKLNELLSGTKYQIIPFTVHTSKAPSTLKTYLPLIAMFAAVLAFAGVHQLLVGVHGFHLHVFMQYFMAGYFLLFGGLKVLNWKKFVPSYRAYDDVAKRSTIYAWAYPAIEFGLGIMYYFGLAFAAVHVFVLILMLQKAYSVFKKVRSGDTVQCACLGGFFNIPVTWVTFAEDILMAAMAVWMLL